MVYDSVLAGDRGLTECSSKTIYVSLKENDDVFVKQNKVDGDYLFATRKFGLPSFGGVLLSVE